MQIKKKVSANIALAISVAGALGTMPLVDMGILGGMIHNGFLAACIGGMADWFAVTALFSKPLGISYRTEVIKRNKPRIIEALQEFASNDLLSSDNIMKFVSKKNLAQFVVDFWRQNDQTALNKQLIQIFQTHAREIDFTFLSQQFTKLWEEVLSKKNTEELSDNLLQVMIQPRQTKIMVDIFLKWGRELVADARLRQWLETHLAVVLQKYTEDNTSRAMVMNMLSLHQEQLADKLLQGASKWLDTLENDSEYQAMIQGWLSSKIADQGISWQTMLEKVMGKTTSKEEFNSYLLSKLQELLVSDYVANKIQVGTDYVFNTYLIQPENMQRLDKFIKEHTISLIQSNHSYIDQKIAEKLAQWTDEKIVNTVEEKAADDLQIIRINGSIVGGLVGMLLYVLTAILGQVMTL